jgi:hypothetical protein
MRPSIAHGAAESQALSAAEAPRCGHFDGATFLIDRTLGNQRI